MPNPPFPDPRQLKALRDLEAAVAYQRQGQPADAEKAYARVVKKNPDYFDALHLYGVFKFQRNEAAEAARLVSKATKINPRSADAFNTLGVILASGLNRHAGALASLDAALALNAGHVPALSNRAMSLNALGRHDEALASAERALALDARHAEAHVGRGTALLKFKKYQDAISSYERALQLNGRIAGAWLGLGQAFDKLKRHADAAIAYQRLLAADPLHAFAKGLLLHQKMLCCDWTGLDALIADIGRDIAASKPSAEPFGYQAVAQSPRDFQRAAEIYGRTKYPRSPAPLWRGERYDNPKIRIGYVSGEFRHQVVSMLLARVFELHDKNRFEIVAFDSGWDDGSEIRARIDAAFDALVDISRMSDQQAAAAIRERQIDILVDLNGYFGEERTGVFAHRPAPVAVNYLGFSATMGADYIDYIVADRCIIPPEMQPFYTEKVVTLPDTFQANDDRRPPVGSPSTRASLGLPESGFVFSCFSNNFKVTPEIFDVWMRLLRAIDGSVLWLFDSDLAVAGNLRAEAQRRDIAPERVIVTPRAKAHADYLARFGAADLFLDTFPFNAGGTASDSLWAGLPLLTCSGELYTARMAASLLNAIGLPELITSSLAGYEAMAIRIARDPALLASLKLKLAANRATCPLFDSARFTRHLEAAFVTMAERTRRGEAPASFTIEPLV